MIFGLSLEQDLEEDTKYETAFKTFDARDYSLIATIETKKSVLHLCPSWDDSNLAVIEQVSCIIFNYYAFSRTLEKYLSFLSINESMTESSVS